MLNEYVMGLQLHIISIKFTNNYLALNFYNHHYSYNYQLQLQQPWHSTSSY